MRTFSEQEKKKKNIGARLSGRKKKPPENKLN